MPTTILHAPTAGLATTVTTDLTVEAEYGGFVALGTVYTAAHHQPSGPYAGRHVVEGGRPSPCNDPAVPCLNGGGTILISHLDLDSIGGCLRAFPEFAGLFSAEYAAFWEAAEFVDVRGPHRLPTNHPQRPFLLAIWAWLQNNRGQFPRDAVADATSAVLAAGVALRSILIDSDVGMLAEGHAMDRREDDLNATSYVDQFDVPVGGREFTVVLRRSDGFTNHLYRLLGGGAADAVVALNTKLGAVTCSLASPEEWPGVVCREIVRLRWPEVEVTVKRGTATERIGTYASRAEAEAALANHPDREFATIAHTAGGHPGIAGGPRGVAVTWDDVEAVARLMVAAATAPTAN